jgi:hypothetical protein
VESKDNFVYKHNLINRVKSARSYATIPNVCRILGVGKIKGRITRTNRLKLITKESFSSGSSDNEETSSKIDFISNKEKQVDVNAIEIYDLNGLPIQANANKKVTSLIFEDPVKKFIEDRDK